MSWRPKGRDDSAPSVDGYPYDDYKNGYDAGVVAGADAMLEWLRSRGQTIDAEAHVRIFHHPTHFHYMDMDTLFKPGILVFIPDDPEPKLSGGTVTREEYKRWRKAN